MTIPKLETPQRRKQVALMMDLRETLGRHSDLPAIELLAVAAQLVGNLTAFQDQSRYTPKIIMDLVATNVQEGNRIAVLTAQVNDNPKGNA